MLAMSILAAIVVAIGVAVIRNRNDRQLSIRRLSRGDPRYGQFHILRIAMHSVQRVPPDGRCGQAEQQDQGDSEHRHRFHYAISPTASYFLGAA